MASIGQLTPLKAVSLTHVRYAKGDKLGHLLAWASLLPVMIGLGGFLSHFIFRRELQAMFFGLGLIISEIINQYIKELADEARPLTCQVLEICDSNGWPSSHSQYMTFFSIYLTLLATQKFTFSDKFSKYFTIILPWPFALVVIYSRVYLGYHTVAQVIAGSIVGLVLGATWFFIVSKYFVPYFPVIEGTSVCRYLCIKDSSHVPNVLQFEYDNCRNSRTERKARSD
jgi:dolichyldiphosphatase